MQKIQISLAAARVNAQLTQSQVAKEMHVSKNTIVNWEKGNTVPKIAEVEKLSRLYHIPETYIFLPCYSTISGVNSAAGVLENDVEGR